MVFGFRLHAPTNEYGLFEWAFAPANQSDVTLAHELLEGLEDKLVWGDPTLAPHACTSRRKDMAREDNGQSWLTVPTNALRRASVASFVP